MLPGMIQKRAKEVMLQVREERMSCAMSLTRPKGMDLAHKWGSWL